MAVFRTFFLFLVSLALCWEQAEGRKFVGETACAVGFVLLWGGCVAQHAYMVVREAQLAAQKSRGVMGRDPKRRIARVGVGPPSSLSASPASAVRSVSVARKSVSSGRKRTREDEDEVSSPGTEGGDGGGHHFPLLYPPPVEERVNGGWREALINWAWTSDLTQRRGMAM